MTRLAGFLAGAGVCGLCGVAMLTTPTADAQTIDVGRPRNFVVGTPPGARVDRVDAARTARSRTALPTSGIRTAWRTSAGSPVESPPLVDARGRVYVVNVRGDVLALAPDGTESWHVATSALQPGNAALLSDDTLVFTDGSGDAIAVRDGRVRWRSRFGRAEPSASSPLPLDDGGVIVATGHDLAALDADGHARARTTLPEALGAPLLASRGRVLAIATTGTVWAWTPGATEPTRLASFGTPVDGSAALADDHTLVAVTGGQSTLSALDLVRGAPADLAPTSPLSSAPGGGIWLGSPAMRGRETSLALLGPAGELLVTFDAAGAEVRRTLLTARVPLARADGGAPPAAALISGLGGDASLLVDGAGTLAFAALDGSVGVVTAGDGTVERLADACPSMLGLGPGGFGALGGGSPVVGLAPVAAGTFVAVCRSGAVVAVTGEVGGR